MTSEFKEELSKMETGSVALVYSDPNSDLTVEVMVMMVMIVMTADYFCAADYLRLPKFSLTNSCIFRENTQFFTKIVVVGSGDRTTCPTPVPVFQVVKRLEL